MGNHRMAAAAHQRRTTLDAGRRDLSARSMGAGCPARDGRAECSRDVRASFLNGLYWGIYNLTERPDDDFAAVYCGGREGEYDVVSDGRDLHAGNWTAWRELLHADGLSDRARYQRLLGNDPNGVRDSQLPVQLDVTNLVDYMILHIFIGADDWPDHNWWVARRRGAESTGFKFFAWDQEISIN